MLDKSLDLSYNRLKSSEQKKEKKVSEKMTAAQARTFNTHSQENAAILEAAAALRGCDCRPYVDWFTYNRWQAQDQQVQRGEHGVKILTWIETEKKDKKTGEVKRELKPRRATVFCRCQVKKMEEVK